MNIQRLILDLTKISEDMPDAEVVLDVDEDSKRHLNICEVIRGDKVVIIAADLLCK